MITAKQPTVL